MDRQVKQMGVFGTIIILIIGIGILFGATYYKKHLDNKYGDWIHIKATVVDYEKEYKRDSDHGYDWYYREIVEYEVDGNVYKQTSQSSSNIRPIIGSTRDIAYNPNDPQDSVFYTKDKNLLSIILYAMGGLFTIAGVAGLTSKILKKRRVKQEDGPLL